MSPTLERTDPDGVDFRWVMQTTFVITIVVGAPTVAILALGMELPTWDDRVAFAVRVGAVVWIVTALGVYTYARKNDRPDTSDQSETGAASSQRESEAPDRDEDERN